MLFLLKFLCLLHQGAWAVIWQGKVYAMLLFLLGQALVGCEIFLPWEISSDPQTFPREESKGSLKVSLPRPEGKIFPHRTWAWPSLCTRHIKATMLVGLGTLTGMIRVLTRVIANEGSWVENSSVGPVALVWVFSEKTANHWNDQYWFNLTFQYFKSSVWLAWKL